MQYQKFSFQKNCSPALLHCLLALLFAGPTEAFAQLGSAVRQVFITMASVL
jgi:hypothetical protein